MYQIVNQPKIVNKTTSHYEKWYPNGYGLFVSYKTVVGAFVPSVGYVRTVVHHSVTTEKHLTTAWKARWDKCVPDWYLREIYTWLYCGAKGNPPPCPTPRPQFYPETKPESRAYNLFQPDENPVRLPLTLAVTWTKSGTPRICNNRGEVMHEPIVHNGLSQREKLYTVLADVLRWLFPMCNDAHWKVKENQNPISVLAEMGILVTETTTSITVTRA